MEIILIIIVLIFSIIAHEVAHGYAAYALGDPTAKLAGRLTLNPLPHVDLVGSIIIPALLVFSNAGMLFGWAKPVPYNPYNLRNQRWGEAFVAFAGPATNLFIAIIFALVVRLAVAGDMGAAASFASTICFTNLFLGLFNLIPFPPMDGYTVLRGSLPFRFAYSLRQFEAQIHALGVGGIFIVLVLFYFLFIDPFYSFVSAIFNFLV